MVNYQQSRSRTARKCREEQPLPVILPAEGLIRLPTVLSVYPVARSTWWKGIREGRYPPPVRIGAKSVAWRVNDIRRLIREHTA